MNIRIPGFLNNAALLCAVMSVSLSASFAQAQQEPSTSSRATAQTAPATARLDPAAALRTEIQQCGAPCKMGGPGRITAPGGGTLDYNCNEDGDCSCFGAKDCVAMSDICKEDTMGCNKQGCVCEKE